MRLCDALNDYIKPPQPPPQGARGACGTKPGTSCNGVAGGGKFLLGSAVSVLNFIAQGETVTNGATFQFTGVESQISAFNYKTGVSINQVYLSSLNGSKSSSGDLTVVGTGTASVNGVMKFVQITTAKLGSAVSFQITDLVSGLPLAGGAGEANLSSLQYF